MEIYRSASSPDVSRGTSKAPDRDMLEAFARDVLHMVASRMLTRQTVETGGDTDRRSGEACVFPGTGSGARSIGFQAQDRPATRNTIKLQ
jgi:aconitase B